MLLRGVRVADDPGKQRVIATVRVGLSAEQRVETMLRRLAIAACRGLEADAKATQPWGGNLNQERRLSFQSGRHALDGLVNDETLMPTDAMLARAARARRCNARSKTEAGA